MRMSPSGKPMALQQVEMGIKGPEAEQAHMHPSDALVCPAAPTTHPSHSRVQGSKGAGLRLAELGRQRAAHQGAGGEAQADEPAGVAAGGVGAGERLSSQERQRPRRAHSSRPTLTCRRQCP